jgi:hypothetical protein
MKYRSLFFFVAGLFSMLMVSQGCRNFSGFALKGIDGSGVWGTVTDEQQKPVAGAQVYAYEQISMEQNVSGNETKIEDLIKEELNGEVNEKNNQAEMSFNNQFRRPADYVSGVSDADGAYFLSLPPGSYCLTARKRADDQPGMGPLTPEDLTSLISRPVEIAENRSIRLDFELRSLADDIFFSSQYAIRISNTRIQGKIIDADGQPLAGLVMIANQRPKLSLKPDYTSLPSGEDGSFMLYLPGGGIYYLGLKQRPLEEYLPCQIDSAYVNQADNTIELSTGDLISKVKVISLKEPQEEE